MPETAIDAREASFDLANTIADVRTAQREWQVFSIRDRLTVVRKLRGLIAKDPRGLTDCCNRANVAETLAAEVLPVADACRFLEKTALSTLKSKRLSGRGRSVWLRGVSVELQRDPFGVVLIVAPSNYPLMLPGIQAIQALVAGNAVLWKPAAGCAAAGHALRQMFVGAGLDGRLLTILPDTIEATQHAVEAGVDKVVLTGSVPTGRAIQSLLTDKLTPSTVELSGCDAMFVTPTADLDRAARCLVMGLMFNGSRTCIAPRRVFVDKAMVSQFQERLLSTLRARVPSPPRETCEDTHDLHSGERVRVRGPEARTNADEVIQTKRDPLTPALSPDSSCKGVGSSLAGERGHSASARQMMEAAIAAGAKVLHGNPTVLTEVTPDMDIANSDVFEPVTSIMPYGTIDQAIWMNDQCPYALGATVFGADDAAVAELVRRIDAGCIVVNDMIVPTADPRVPFGGRKQSGFGITRGTAGLEEMTQLKAIVRQRSSWLPHLDEPTPVDADVLAGLIQTLHAPSLFGRMKNSFGLLRATLAQRKYRKKNN